MSQGTSPSRILVLLALSIAASSLLLTACAAMDEGQRQTIYVPTPSGVEVQTVYTGRAKDADQAPSSDEAGIAVPPGSDAKMRELLTRLVVATDYCWNEGETYLGLKYGSPFDREYLQDHDSLKTRRSPLFYVQIQMACLFVAEDLGERRPLSTEEARLVKYFMKALGEQGPPSAELLSQMRDYAERTESGGIAPKTYLTDINQELFGVGIFSRPSHGLDSCGTQFCRPLSFMCDPRALREFQDEGLAASFRQICRLRDHIEARR